jgi:hypothetical protein
MAAVFRSSREVNKSAIGVDKDERRERRKARYANMSPDQRQARRKYQSQWMARHRAKLREQAKGQTLAGAPASPPQPSIQSLATQTPIARRTELRSTPARSSKPAVKELSPRAAQKLHRAWRTEVRDQILDFLTSGQCSLTGRDYESNRIYGLWFGIFDRLTQLEKVADNEDQLSELRLSVAVEALRRLSGEAPAGCAPALALPVTR